MPEKKMNQRTIDGNMRCFTNETTNQFRPSYKRQDIEWTSEYPGYVSSSSSELNWIRLRFPYPPRRRNKGPRPRLTQTN